MTDYATCPLHGAVLRPVVLGVFRLCGIRGCDLEVRSASSVRIATPLADAIARTPVGNAERARNVRRGVTEFVG